jgi:class 3 adenylate cyclase
MSTEECKRLLKRHVNTKIDLIVMFVDINRSTELSLSLPDKKFILIVQCFAQEITHLVSGYGGYVLKYEGDAVITLSPTMLDLILAVLPTISIHY